MKLPPLPPPKKQHRSPPGPPATLGSAGEWFWLGCYVCNHRVAAKPTIFMNQLGPAYPLEGLRKRGWCTFCGSFGAYTQRPNHVDLVVGTEPFVEERSYHHHQRVLEEERRRSYLVYDGDTGEIRRDHLTLGQSVQAALRYSGLNGSSHHAPGRVTFTVCRGRDTVWQRVVQVGARGSDAAWPEIHGALLVDQPFVGRYRAASFDQYRIVAGRALIGDDAASG